ncbi:MAG: hypothetical protein N3A38_06350 [Planctomycetota bacterium]|nr:hypothetical protein [Planctomycetota bacterium]
MAEGRVRADWGRMSVLLALLANVHRDPKRTRAFRPEDFDPFAKADATERKPITTIGRGRGWGLLRAVFVNRKGGRED